MQQHEDEHGTVLGLQHAESLLDEPVGNVVAVTRHPAAVVLHKAAADSRQRILHDRVQSRVGTGASAVSTAAAAARTSTRALSLSERSASVIASWERIGEAPQRIDLSVGPGYDRTTSRTVESSISTRPAIVSSLRIAPSSSAHGS